MRTNPDRTPMGTLADSASFDRRGDPDGMGRVHPDPMRAACLPVCPRGTPPHGIACEPGGTLRARNRGAGSTLAARTTRSDREGFSILGGLILLMALSGGVGLWISARHLRAITERQVNFDRCTGIAVLRIRAWITAHERSWKRLEAARRVTLPLLPTPAGPAALEALRLLLLAERGNQERIRTEWIRETLRWNLLTGLGCRLRRRPDRSAFPEHDLKLVDPDVAGLLSGHPLDAPVPQNEYRVGIASRNQRSSALTRRAPDETWKVRWIP